VAWVNGSLLDFDLTTLLDFLDYTKINHNQPFAFTPQFSRPENYLTRIDQDNVNIQDVYKFHPDAPFSKRISAVLPLEPVYFK
jgi:hypothetical protein